MNLEKTIRIKIINKNINENIYKNNEEEKKTKYCKCCKCTLLTEKYFRINRKGEYNKTCNVCLDRRAKNAKKNKCEHGRKRSRCKDCGGSQICEHNKIRSTCKECGGGSVCEHGKRRARCKECGGGSICEHNRERSTCKDCGGSQICEHNKIRSVCKSCKGGSICEHNRNRSKCKSCDGGSICKHSRQRSHCKDCGGSQICEHNKIRSRCKPCKGGSICEHDKHRRVCQICDPGGHLKGLVSTRVRHALKNKKSKKTLEYLGCTIKDFRKHIEKSFIEGMSWDNYGDWEIDHICPVKYDNPTIEEVIERLYWTNTQALWKVDNRAKCNHFIG